jgi:formylglycine-generating enzyme required for sulfatase activity
MEFVPVPAGEFQMGSSPEEIEQLKTRFPNLRDDRVAPEQPGRRVRITRGFLIGKYEVTVAQYRAFVMDARYLTEAERVGGPSVYDQGEDWAEDPDASWMAPGFLQRDNHPVVCVTWNDAQAFVQWLNRMDGRKPEGWVYRLPTEAEWEYAARGADRRAFPWGTEWKGPRANFGDKQSGLPWGEAGLDDGFPRTAPVGAFSPDGNSPFGACDMAGNVWEWCEDAFAPDAYSQGADDDPLGERGNTKVERGGGWSFSREDCRTTYRFHLAPSKSYDTLGFRVVLAPAPPDTDF